mmetsp:Transcript_82813/g.239577  ORF Transcript_82813/g.239577 Transcript_82813/m.239577 type:complete len:205 (-) Transcript_82813:660-1274(-)
MVMSRCTYSLFWEHLICIKRHWRANPSAKHACPPFCGSSCVFILGSSKKKGNTRTDPCLNLKGTRTTPNISFDCTITAAVCQRIFLQSVRLSKQHQPVASSRYNLVFTKESKFISMAKPCRSKQRIQRKERASSSIPNATIIVTMENTPSRIAPTAMIMILKTIPLSTFIIPPSVFKIYLFCIMRKVQVTGSAIRLFSARIDRI